MSIATCRNSFGLPVVCFNEAESELENQESSDPESSQLHCSEEKQSTRYSFDADETIVCESKNVSFETSNVIEDKENQVIHIVTRKRRRSLSSCEDDQESRSRSVSPEITYGGTPVTYKLHEINGELWILKKPMTSPRGRAQKCSDRDISRMVNSNSDDETIYDCKKSETQIIGSLPKEFENVESPKTPKRAQRHSSRSTDSESKENALQNTPSKSISPQETGVPLRMKFRRSTEQSNYKVETNIVHEKSHKVESPQRSSKRSNLGTPKRCGVGNCDEDHSMYKKTRGNTPQTPKTSVIPRKPGRTPITRRMRKMSGITNDQLENVPEDDRPEAQEKESDIDEADDDFSSRCSEKKLSSRRGSETPKKLTKKLEDVITPRSVRPRRNSRFVNYNYDNIDLENNIRDKVNKSDDDESISSRIRGQRKLDATPNSGSTRNMKNLEDPSTPKRTQRQLNIFENETTPKRTPRTPRRIKAIEDAQTPKRKNQFQTLDEVSTPKRTPRRSAMSKIEETVTPTKSGRKAGKFGTPSLRNSCLTPSMSRRTANIGRPITILEEARAKLHVSAVPKSLPCREEEFNDIFQFLERKLLDNNGGCIYISGVPGTGKTATVNEVVRCLKKLVAKGDLENFDFIEINGMKLSEPRQAYVQILKQIDGQSATWEQAHQILEKRFTKSSANRPMTLLLVDELDLLCNKRQDVVYNLLDWPAKQNAQLVVITIANTMDLPERVLMGRVTSRLGLTRLTFQPYNHKQLQEIVMARLKDSDAFKSEAIQLVARKVAAVSGDARRALDICRRSTEIAELNNGEIVTMQHVNQALTEMIASAKVQAIKHCSEMEKIFLQAVCAEVTRTGVEETSFHNVYRQLESLCSFEGLKIPNVTQTLSICGRLGANRLLLCEHSRTDTQQRILLNVSSDDIHFAMQKIAVS